MKKVFFIISVVVCFWSCKEGSKNDSKAPVSQEAKEKALTDTVNFTAIQWLDSTHLDLGKVKEGALVEVSYRFKNSGNKNLVISDVTASCGCTIPEKPEKIFAPGEEGMIKAKFDSKGRTGENQKHIYVTANTNPSVSHELSFNVEVISN